MRKFKVTSWQVDHLEMINGIWTPIYDKDLPVKAKRFTRPAITKYIEIPCGQCIGCRLQRSREWANRMLMERETTEGACSFVTLTYDDEHLPMSEGVEPITGEVKEFGNLVLEDLQKFMKRLRRKYPETKIRYYAAGEYGEKTQRPHFHIILFGWFPEDAKFVRKGRKGEYNYYQSDILTELWPYGLHIVTDVTWESCAYTARYVVKKFTGPESYQYEEKNIKPPFVTMSTKPGIGYDYYMQHRELFENEEIKRFYISTDKGSISFSKPRYFKKLEDIQSFIPFSPETYIEVTSKHTKDTFGIMSDQEEERRIIELQTDLEYFEELAVQGLYKKQQTQILKRGMI